MCADYTRGMSRQAIKVLFDYLPRAYKNGSKDYHAREKVHNAATIAGLAFANAFLGICHSLAHKLGAAFHIPHGVANALLISHVIRWVWWQLHHDGGWHTHITECALLCVAAS